VHGIEQLRMYQGCGRGKPIGSNPHWAGELGELAFHASCCLVQDATKTHQKRK